MADRIDSNARRRSVADDSSRSSDACSSARSSAAERSSAEIEPRTWPVGSNGSERLQSVLRHGGSQDSDDPGFGELFESLGSDLRDPTSSWNEASDALRLGHLKYMGPGDLATLVGNRQRLASEIESALTAGFPDKSADDIARRVTQLTGQMESLFTARIRTTIAGRARQTINVARRPFEAIAQNKESRRTFLATVACASNDPGVVSNRLASLGLPEDTCEELGRTLAGISGEDAIASLHAGEPGPTIDGWFSDEGTYDRADRLLKEALGRQLNHLDELDDEARRSAFEKPDSFSGGLSEDGDILTRADFAIARESVFRQFGLDPTRSREDDPVRAGASAILAEAIDEAEEHEDRRAFNDSVINAGWSLMTVGTGTVADLTSLGAETAIKAGLAQDELQRTQLAHQIGLAGEAAIAGGEGEVASVVATGVAAALFPDSDSGILASFVESQMKEVAKTAVGDMARARAERRVRDRHRGAHLDD